MFTHKFLEINDARVAKLADAPDLGSGGEILRGSSPLPGTSKEQTSNIESEAGSPGVGCWLLEVRRQIARHFCSRECLVVSISVFRQGTHSRAVLRVCRRYRRPELFSYERPPLRLSADPDQSLQGAFPFRFCCGAGRPAFHNFEREESEQRQTSRFQIESQILRNLLDGPDAIELRCKLRLVGGQFQFLNAFEPVFRVSGNRCWIEAYVLIEILKETQGFQSPVVHVRRPRHIGSIAQQIGILLKHDPYAWRHPKLGEKSLPVILHQLHRWLAVYRFFAGKSKEKRGSGFSLLIAPPVNNHHIDVGENGRRLRAIKVWISSCDKNDLAVPRQKVDLLLIPKCPQRACQLLFRDRLKRAVQ